ncbi:MAG: hypothetical protein HY815_15040 [Candidatus Riflebacteria bacterium]|nr:hypothetical protein [Candidatus Riflebacteria bacterium]
MLEFAGYFAVHGSLSLALCLLWVWGPRGQVARAFRLAAFLLAAFVLIAYGVYFIRVTHDDALERATFVLVMAVAYGALWPRQSRIQGWLDLGRELLSMALVALAFAVTYFDWLEPETVQGLLRRLAEIPFWIVAGPLSLVLPALIASLVWGTIRARGPSAPEPSPPETADQGRTGALTGLLAWLLDAGLTVLAVGMVVGLSALSWAEFPPASCVAFVLFGFRLALHGLLAISLNLSVAGLVSSGSGSWFARIRFAVFLALSLLDLVSIGTPESPAALWRACLAAALSLAVLARLRAHMAFRSTRELAGEIGAMTCLALALSLVDHAWWAGLPASWLLSRPFILLYGCLVALNPKGILEWLCRLWDAVRRIPVAATLWPAACLVLAETVLVLWCGGTAVQSLVAAGLAAVLVGVVVAPGPFGWRRTAAALVLLLVVETYPVHVSIAARSLVPRADLSLPERLQPFAWPTFALESVPVVASRVESRRSTRAPVTAPRPAIGDPDGLSGALERQKLMPEKRRPEGPTKLKYRPPRWVRVFGESDLSAGAEDSTQHRLRVGFDVKPVTWGRRSPASDPAVDGSSPGQTAGRGFLQVRVPRLDRVVTLWPDPDATPCCLKSFWEASRQTSRPFWMAAAGVERPRARLFSDRLPWFDADLALESHRVPCYLVDHLALASTTVRAPSEVPRAGTQEPCAIETVPNGPNEVRLRLSPRVPGFLYLADGYSPAWKSRVNGLDTPVLRANLTFKAVAVGAGPQEIVLRYEPRRILFGMLLGVVAVLLSFVMFVVSSIRGVGLPLLPAIDSGAGAPARPGPGTVVIGGQAADCAIARFDPMP